MASADEAGHDLLDVYAVPIIVYVGRYVNVRFRRWRASYRTSERRNRPTLSIERLREQRPSYLIPGGQRHYPATYLPTSMKDGM